MINELNEMLKEYSHKYFIKEFRKSKPKTAYNKLQYKCVGVFVGSCILGELCVLSIIYRGHLGECWYWIFLCLLLSLFVGVFCLVELDSHRMTVLSGMASAYLENHGEREKIQDCFLLTTRKEKMQYIYFIKNSYRASIVRQYLGKDYSIGAIKALKDEVEIKDVKLGLDFISVCSIIALCVALVTWYGLDIEHGWPIVLVSFLLLVAIPVIIYVIKLGEWEFFKSKKHKELRETLTFMLYDYR